jgi:hypothetical protein
MGIITGSGETWVPFRLACTLPYLRKGSLNVGNTQQNRLSLAAAAISQANSPSNPPWAKWRLGFQSTTSTAGLLINPRLVPGYTAPPGTGYVNVPAGGALPTITAGQSEGIFTGYANATADANLFSGGSGFGSIANPTVNGQTVTGFAFNGESGNLSLIVGASGLAKSWFTSVSFTGSAGLETHTSASSTFISNDFGYGSWSWSVANHMVAGNQYALTIV